MLLSASLIVNGTLPAWQSVHSDFANYYVSSRLVLEGGSVDRLYDNEWFQGQIRAHNIDTPGKFSPFPPLTAWVMLPIAYTDALTAMRIWLFVNLVLLVFCTWLICLLTPWHWSNAASILLASGNGLVNNFKYGQVYLLITTGLFLVLYLAWKKNHWTAGVLLGLLSWLKYLPIAIIAGFIATRNYKTVLVTGLSLVGLFMLQTWIFGFSLMTDFFRSVFLPHLDGELSGQEMYSFLFQSWDNFFRHLFVYAAEYNPSPFMDWPSGRMLAKVLVYLVVAMFLYLSMRKVFRGELVDHTKISLLLALPFLAAFVVLPASASYHFVVLVFPIVLLISNDFFSEKEKIGIVLVFSLIGFIPYGLFFNISEKAGLIFAYPRLWLISILYFGCVWLILRKSFPLVTHPQ